MLGLKICHLATLVHDQFFRVLDGQLEADPQNTIQLIKKNRNVANYFLQ
jgi:hypothetical protein